MIKEVATEIIKEVPVEKIVKVEIPVEIIKKEIVHVPLYTEDKSLLKLAENHRFDEHSLEKDDAEPITENSTQKAHDNGHNNG